MSAPRPTPVTEPPVDTMPGVWDAPDGDGFPMRHKPLRPFGDLWECVCGEFAFPFLARRTVIEKCLPCLGCYPSGSEEPR